MFELFGEKLFPGFGGLLLMEAGKQIYAPLAAKSRLDLASDAAEFVTGTVLNVDGGYLLA